PLIGGLEHDLDVIGATKGTDGLDIDHFVHAPLPLDERTGRDVFSAGIEKDRDACHNLFSLCICHPAKPRLNVDASFRRRKSLRIAVDRPVCALPKVVPHDDGLPAERRRNPHRAFTPRKSRPASSRYCRALGARPRMPPLAPSPNVMDHLPSEMERMLSSPASSVPRVSRSCNHHSTCAHTASRVASDGVACPSVQ